MKTRKVKLKKKSEPEVVTKKGVAIFVALIALAIVGFVFGVRMGLAKKDAKLVSSSELKNRGLYYQLKMGKTEYELGEPIGVELSVTNITPNPIVLDFKKSLEFDITVRKEVDLMFAQLPKVVWKLSSQETVILEKHVVRLDAGKTLTYKASWNQKDRDQKPVSPGRYQIIANLLADNREEALQVRGQTGSE